MWHRSYKFIKKNSIHEDASAQISVFLAKGFGRRKNPSYWQILSLNKHIANLIETFSCILFFYSYKVIFTQLSFQVSIVNWTQFDILLKLIYFQLSLCFPVGVPDFVIHPYTQERGEFKHKDNNQPFFSIASIFRFAKARKMSEKITANSSYSKFPTRIQFLNFLAYLTLRRCCKTACTIF